jgi:anti-sigma factor RsiW
MRCIKDTREGAELLLDFCAGSLEAGRGAELERHIAGCDDCRELVEAQRAMWSALDQWVPPAVSPGFNARMHARVAGETSGWRTWLPGVLQPAVPYSIWKSAALAAAGAVLVAGFLVHSPHARDTTVVAQGDVDKGDKGDKVDIEQVANTLEELDMLTPAPASAM